MANKDRVLIYTNYHRPIPLYDQCTAKLVSKGWKLFKQETGNPHLNYDQAMVLAKSNLQERDDIDYVLFLDNDCFLQDDTYIQQLIDETAEVGYDVVYFFEGWNGGAEKMTSLEFGDCLISPVTDIKFEKVEQYPGFKPFPHYESALMLMRRDTFLSLSDTDLSHGRLWYKALWLMGSRMGVHRTQYRGHTHFGPGWFHIGALMSIYYQFEKGVEEPEVATPEVHARWEFMKLQFGQPTEGKNLKELVKGTWLENSELLWGNQ